MAGTAAAHRHSDLENAMAELARAQARTQADLRRTDARLDRIAAETKANLDRLSAEMRAFKDEMRAFKDEMQAFKDEMQAFKDEMQAFKDEMRAFKDEMRAASARADKRWGELANKMGTLVEDIVAPGIPEIFARLFGTSEDISSAIRVKCQDLSGSGRHQEYDVLAWNKDVLLINETRSRMSPDDVPELLAMVKDVRSFIPQSQTRKVVGSLASFYVDPSIVTAGERAGLIMIGLGTGLLEILNSPNFKPTEF